MTSAISRSSDFLASIGVNTHINYTDGGYANVNNLAADLAYLGITSVRDTISDGEYGSAPLSSYIALAQKGITFTIIIGGGSMTTADLTARLALIAKLIAAVPGSVTAVEGPNEINNQSFSYNGVSGLAGAVALQKDLYAAVHGSSTFAGVAVDYFTGYDAGNIAVGPDPATTAGLADYDTQHPYPNNGDAPAAWVSTAKALGNETGTQGAAVYTETGYSSNGGTSGAVNADVQAKYTLDLLFDTYKDGVARTDLYELLDAYAPGSAQGDAGYGLFGTGNVAKPVATALHNLNAILADTGAAATTFATGTLSPTVTGLPATGNSLVLEKSSGTFDLVLWAEPKIWNEATGTELTAAAASVTVDLGAAYAQVSVYDPMTGTTAIATATNARTVTVALTDHPLIIEIAGGIVTTTPSTTTASSTATTGSAATTTGTAGTTGAAASTTSTAAPVAATVASLPAKAAAGHSYAVTDTASAIGNGLGTLRDFGAANIAGVTVSSGTLDVRAAAFVANQAVLDKVTTGFTVSDMASAILANLDALAGDSHLTGISTTGAMAVSVATYLADRAALDKLVNGFTISDTAAHIATAATTIAADKVVKTVTATDAATTTTAATATTTTTTGATPSATVSTGTTAAATALTVAALPAKAATGQTYAVADTASAIGNGLGTLRNLAASLSTVTVTSGTLDVQAAAFAANRAVLDKVVGGFTVSDMAAPIVANLDALAADTHVTSISTGGAVSVAVATFVKDQAGLDKLVNGFGVSGTAADLAAAAATIAADKKITSVTTTNGSGVAVAEDIFNADGTLNRHETIATNADGSQTVHVSAGSVLSGQSYASFDEGVATTGKVLSRTFEDATGRVTAATLYNADGTLKMYQTMSLDAAGDTVTHATGGSAFDNTASVSSDTVTSAAGVLLSTETTGRDGSHQFALTGDALTVAASRNDTFTATGHNETVTFANSGFGKDVFTGYTAGDTFQFSTKLFKSFADLQSHVSGGANAVITIAAGDTLTLTGVTASGLAAGMFKFV